MTTFDPSLLPDPVLLSAQRQLNLPQPRTTSIAQWFTPTLLFGQVGTVTPLGVVGRIPVIYPCVPIAWYLSSNVPATMTMQLEYAPPPANMPTGIPRNTADLKIIVGDVPVYTTILLNSPHITSVNRTFYEQTPSIEGWPRFMDRYGEIQVTVLSNDFAEQVLLVLYMVRLQVRSASSSPDGVTSSSGDFLVTVTGDSIILGA